MRMVDIISKKRYGGQLSREEIDFFIRGYTMGTIPDYQASALAMAICFQGMDYREMADLTIAMVKSGETIDLSRINGVKVDKHSTGGVGDTTTLVLAPLVASLGIPVAKMSGRGLGYTGGTIDKLESIEGFHAEITENKFIQLVNDNKIAVMGQAGNLTPADKKLYALRDVTATVESIPLIASSIMSKKIAAGADAIVLDVKAGSGAFMKNDEDAEKLARAMVRIGNRLGRNSMAVISDMSQPLGFAVGNSLEVKEAVDTLKGKGPHDLEELVLTLGSHMVLLAGKADNTDEAREKLVESIKSGRALEKFKSFVKNQGGDSSIVDSPEKLPQAKYKIPVPAERDGVVSHISAGGIGISTMLLGAGRSTKEDSIDPSVGVVLRKKIGDRVKKGDELLMIYSNCRDVDGIAGRIRRDISIDSSAEKPELIHKIITK
ncbi:MAG TPA: pyrimidine-nucleoside phosphorylase [Clostridium sp.]|uniref:Pyrimidine-nucleoside phosphorylase n=1 Tax=Clostridium lapidicellarium TaxID=3240931 RepID=A0ABV4DZI4_9CLOT|nr:pyrimidine-nucleoside phosphorylase [uncultured Clostridium sp.]HBC96668.1 pyrimidine-nucleoside phosphorylase [Clostridium sp.]